MVRNVIVPKGGKIQNRARMCFQMAGKFKIIQREKITLVFNLEALKGFENSS